MPVRAAEDLVEHQHASPLDVTHGHSVLTSASW